jgi:hypothetical protein
MCSPCVCALSDLVWPAALDGNQVLDFYWTDPIDAIIRSLAKLQYQDKLYTTFKPAMAIAHQMVRAFDKANSGMVFQSAYLVDSKSSPLLALFYADASFSGKACHIIQFTLRFFFIYVLLLVFYLCVLSQCVC